MSVIANAGPTMSFVPGAALGIGARVRLASGKLAAAGTTDLNCIGNMENPAYGDANPPLVAVRMRNPPIAAIASEAMPTIGVEVFAGVSGTIALTGTVKVGILLEAASASGSIVMIMPY